MRPEKITENTSLLSYFAKEQLDIIQERLSKVTGLGFVTVNYRGESISDRTGFCDFCKCFRDDATLSENCRFSDAMSSIQAAVTEKPCIYLCPCGLIEIAIPIIVDDVYLGGFLCGQVRCENAPAGIMRMQVSTDQNVFSLAMERTKDLRERLPLYPYEKIVDIANMVALFISMLTESKKVHMTRETQMQERIDLLENLQEQVLLLTEILSEKNYGRLRGEMPSMAAKLCSRFADNPSQCMEAFHYLAVNTEKFIRPNGGNILESFPFQLADVKDRNKMTFWLYKVMDALFRENAAKEYDILTGVFGYVDSRISENLTLGNIVRECNISQGYLSRLFRSAFGCSVTDYLHIRKINCAKELMYETGCDAQEAAYQLGYRESSYFSRIFKKYEKMTLTEYKKQLKL